MRPTVRFACRIAIHPGSLHNLSWGYLASCDLDSEAIQVTVLLPKHSTKTTPIRLGHLIKTALAKYVLLDIDILDLVAHKERPIVSVQSTIIEHIS